MDRFHGVLLGRMVNASNSTLICEDNGERFVYKPVSGEKALWDFPDGTLAMRERAAFVMSNLLGWNIVPRTRLMEGDFGVGSVQDWIDGDVLAVQVTSADQTPHDWLTVLTGLDETGAEVVLSHANDARLAQIALFDAVINNADRKGGHILTGAENVHFAIDHGVTFHHEPKLRTVLWGWIDDPIQEDWHDDLLRARNQLGESELMDLLSPLEIDALADRIDDLIEAKIFPEPNGNWPAVPWPVF